MALIDAIIDFLRRRGLPWPRIKKIRYFDLHSSVPTELHRWQLAVVGSDERPKWAVFNCPCGKGHMVQLNLQEQARARWRLSVGTRGPNIHPSVRFVGPPFCHFWIRDGRVIWAHAEAPTN